MNMSSARDTPLGETAADSSCSTAAVFRHLFLPLCSSLATARFLRSVVSAATAASTSTMGTGDAGYQALVSAATAASTSTMGAGDAGYQALSVLAPPLLLLRVQFQDARLKTDVAKTVCRSCTLDDDDNMSKQTLTMMISRSCIGIRCHNNV